jgi:hypothetical protein
MAVFPVPDDAREAQREPVELDVELNWVGFVAGSALVAGGLLLLGGKRRAAMVAASAGTALALLDHQQTVRSWWNLLPVYIDGVQRTLSFVQESVSELAAKRDTLHRILGR